MTHWRAEAVAACPVPARLAGGAGCDGDAGGGDDAAAGGGHAGSIAPVLQTPARPLRYCLLLLRLRWWVLNCHRALQQRLAPASAGEGASCWLLLMSANEQPQPPAAGTR